jgi:hypothetical protein
VVVFGAGPVVEVVVLGVRPVVKVLLHEQEQEQDVCLVADF